MAEIGRPTKYDPKFADQAIKLCELGATDVDLAEFFDVSPRTILRWQSEFKDFCRALKVGKEFADTRVERSLYQKAVGFRWVEQEVVKLKKGVNLEFVEIIDVERTAPPDTTACIFWLKNRRKEQWRDRHEHEVGKPGDFENLDAGQLRAVIAERLGMVEPRQLAAPVGKANGKGKSH